MFWNSSFPGILCKGAFLKCLITHVKLGDNPLIPTSSGRYCSLHLWLWTSNSLSGPPVSFYEVKPDPSCSNTSCLWHPVENLVGVLTQTFLTPFLPSNCYWCWKKRKKTYTYFLRCSHNMSRHVTNSQQGLLGNFFFLLSKVKWTDVMSFLSSSCLEWGVVSRIMIMKRQEWGWNINISRTATCLIPC